MATQDEICPGDIGDSLLRLTLADSAAPRRPQEPIELLVDYARADALGGVVLPLECIISGPSGHLERRIFTVAAPVSLMLTPTESGTYVVLLREMAHNKWVGTLRVVVDGKKTSR